MQPTVSNILESLESVNVKIICSRQNDLLRACSIFTINFNRPLHLIDVKIRAFGTDEQSMCFRRYSSRKKQLKGLKKAAERLSAKGLGNRADEE